MTSLSRALVDFSAQDRDVRRLRRSAMMDDGVDMADLCDEEGGGGLEDIPAVVDLFEPRPARVLLAEDDVDMRTLLVHVLSKAGYRVFPVADGVRLRKCLRALRKRPLCPEPDLVVSDVCMPGMSGLEVLRDLRRWNWTTPVIVVTAFGSPQLHVEAERLGAAVVLDKPFGIDRLLDAATNIVPTMI